MKSSLMIANENKRTKKRIHSEFGPLINHMQVIVIADINATQMSPANTNTENFINTKK